MTRATNVRIVVARIAALFLIGLAAYWIFVFVRLDFRPQRRSLYLPIAIVLLTIGCGVWMKSRLALLASLVVSALGSAFTCLMLVGAPSSVALWIQALVLVAYTVIVGPLGFNRQNS